MKRQGGARLPAAGAKHRPAAHLEVVPVDGTDDEQDEDVSEWKDEKIPF
jgi:hypothetical protein